VPLDTTVTLFNASAPDTFIITGDIDAMWLRDSTNQVLPYLPFASEDPELENMLCGVVHRQATNVLIDSFANAFNPTPNGQGAQSDRRKPKMTPQVFEGKYELDSLAAFLKLSYGVYNWTGNNLSCVLKQKEHWLNAVAKAVETIRLEQAGSEEEFDDPSYLFQRTTDSSTETLMLSGRGTPASRTGMSRSFFRASDDATTLPFHIADNAMAIVELRHVAEMVASAEFGSQGSQLAKDMLQLADEMEAGLREFGIMSSGKLGFYAYEVDGFGGQYFMDDANIPGLLSLPYLGFCEKDDPLYLATRARILSSKNPYFFNGTVGAGVGGPHVGLGYIWPMSIMVQAITSTNDQEIMECLDLLKAASTKINIPFMHESFWKNDATQYTRSWFAWANTLFGETLLTIARERPHLILKDEFLKHRGCNQKIE
jgi:meiotically up-regulated gene 157 (Mug157) protein